MRRLKFIFLFLFASIAISFGQTEKQPKKELKEVIPEPPRIEFNDYVEAPSLATLFEMSEEKEKETLESLPEKVKKELLSLKKLDEKAYKEILHESSFAVPFYKMQLRGFFPGDKNLKKSQENEKEMHELELMTKIIGAKYKKSSAADQAVMKKDLNKKLSRLFELRESERKNELKDLERKIKELRVSIDKRIKNKVEIIKRRIQELTGEDDYLKWK